MSICEYRHHLRIRSAQSRRYSGVLFDEHAPRRYSMSPACSQPRRGGIDRSTKCGLLVDVRIKRSGGGERSRNNINNNLDEKLSRSEAVVTAVRELPMKLAQKLSTRCTSFGTRWMLSMPVAGSDSESPLTPKWKRTFINLPMLPRQHNAK